MRPTIDAPPRIVLDVLTLPAGRMMITRATPLNHSAPELSSSNDKVLEVLLESEPNETKDAFVARYLARVKRPEPKKKVNPAPYIPPLLDSNWQWRQQPDMAAIAEARKSPDKWFPVPEVITTPTEEALHCVFSDDDKILIKEKGQEVVATISELSEKLMFTNFSFVGCNPVLSQRIPAPVCRRNIVVTFGGDIVRAFDLAHALGSLLELKLAVYHPSAMATQFWFATGDKDVEALKRFVNQSLKLGAPSLQTSYGADYMARIPQSHDDNFSARSVEMLSDAGVKASHGCCVVLHRAGIEVVKAKPEELSHADSWSEAAKRGREISTDINKFGRIQ